MVGTPLEPHITWRFSDPASMTVNHPAQKSFGWACQVPGCRAGQDLYLDSRDAVRDADDHERREALTLFEPGALVVAVGPGGSGKSRFASVFPTDWVVSLDELRGRLAGDEGEQAVTPQAVQLQDVLVATRMEFGKTTVLDSTNVESRVRAALVAKARRFNRPVVAVVFLTGLGHCGSRNHRRTANRRVPHDTVRWQYEQTRLALPLLAGEGFTEIRTVGG
ncbi:AAA family ATPase [Streptomyces sp. MS1.AVA.3]|uniref:ATP-binding protein n=1 Tax=Streptomyces decoyicus TaxID=249567 RepID=UPI0030BD6233